MDSLIWVYIVPLGLSENLRITVFYVKQTGNCCQMPMVISPAQPAPVLCNADLRYHRSRLRQNVQYISSRVNVETPTDGTEYRFSTDDAHIGAIISMYTSMILLSF